MSDTRRIIRIFLASPGDLQEERRAAKAMIDKYNNCWADYLGYHVELVGWEDTVSVYGRPQGVINRDLERCEYFIGMLWKRWGTPPDSSGDHTSGFEEEYERSVAKRKATGSPQISLFFKTISEDLLSDPGDELKRVLAFKDKITAERNILFETFASLGEFQEKLERCVIRYVQTLKTGESRQQAEERQGPPSKATASQAPSDQDSPSDLPLSEEGTQFLWDLMSRMQQSGQHNEITSIEVARFRLLATAIAKQGNDQQFLGVHDANILFVHRTDLTLSRLEKIALIDTGLKYYSSENVPLWYWFRDIDGFERHWLQLHSVAAPENIRINALSAMRLLSEPFPTLGPFNKDRCKESWFAKGESSAIKRAALGYLAQCGTTQDLEVIREEFDRGDYSTRGAAVEGILRISIRDSHENAVAALIDLQSESIHSGLLDALFKNEAPIDAELLEKGIGHSSPSVRRVIARLLRERGALKVEIAKKLIADIDPGVRFEALKLLWSEGHVHSEDEAKKLLVKSTPARRFGLLISSSETDSQGEKLWHEFREYRFRTMPIASLQRIAAESSILERTAQFVLYERQFSKYGEKLRKAVDDKFKQEFSEYLEMMAQQYGKDNELIEKTQRLENFLRQQYTRKGLDIICRQKDPQDLSRVRSILKGNFVGFSKTDIEYLRKFGEWKDIRLIVGALNQIKNTGSGASLLIHPTPDESIYRVAANAVYSLGRTRFDELLFHISAPSDLIVHLIIACSNETFRGLSDDSLTKLFHFEQDRVRKTAVLKCIRAYPKVRLRRLLDRYISGNVFRYYNVIYWLDFGISLPRERVRSSVGQLLNSESQE